MSVVSYVSQFAPSLVAAKVSALAHRAMHRILRIPFNSVSRNLCHSLFAAAVEPFPFLGTMLPISCVLLFWEGLLLVLTVQGVWDGERSSYSWEILVVFLVFASGCYSFSSHSVVHVWCQSSSRFFGVSQACVGDADCSWLLEYRAVNIPSWFKSFGSVVLHVVKKDHIAKDLSATSNRKALIFMHFHWISMHVW